MRTLKFIAAFLISAAFIIGCQKDNNNANPASATECAEQRGISDGTIIEGQYIVAYSSSLNTRTMTSSRLSELSTRVLQNNGIGKSAMMQSFAGEPGGFVVKLSAAEAEKLGKDSMVSVIEPDRIISLGTCFSVVAPRLVTWNITKVGFGDGTGKTAWIIDSGIDFTHPDLNVDVTRSRSFISSATTANDDNGHGTHVAGIIGAKNNTIGVLGVASGANLVALKVLDKDGKGSLSAIIQALAYVNSNAQAGDVVNMSLGEDGPSAILDQQVQNTAAKGIFIAIAAGNDGKAAVGFSPGRANGDNIFTVSAVDSLGNFASFSNFGNDVVDYAAPGVRILSTYSNGRYAILSGTSMATPHVAGLLLLDGRNIKTSGLAKNDPDGTADPIAQK